MISVGELRKGIMLELDGQLLNVLDYQHIKMGRGSAQVRMKLKNARTGAIMERTFQAGERFQRVRLDQRSVQYLYKDEHLFYFMDTQSYEQLALNVEQLGDAVDYLRDGTVLEVLLYENEPIGVELPAAVELKVERTDPGFKGDTAAGGTKPATLETGRTIQVPLFVNEGDVVRVDTRDGSYLERVT